MADVALAIGMQPGKLPAKSSLQTSISIPRMWFADLSFAPYRAPGINLRAEHRVQPVQVDGQAPGLEHSQRCRRAHLAPKAFVRIECESDDGPALNFCLSMTPFQLHQTT